MFIYVKLCNTRTTKDLPHSDLSVSNCTLGSFHSGKSCVGSVVGSLSITGGSPKQSVQTRHLHTRHICEKHFYWQEVPPKDITRFLTHTHTHTHTHTDNIKTFAHSTYITVSNTTDGVYGPALAILGCVIKERALVYFSWIQQVDAICS